MTALRVTTAVLAAAITAALAAAPASASPPDKAAASAISVIGAHHPDHDDPLPKDTGEGLAPVVEVPAGAGRIIGSPHAGPQPQQSGDRGGRLQLATLGALAAAVALIAWRVVRASRRARASVPNPD